MTISVEYIKKNKVMTEVAVVDFFKIKELGPGPVISAIFRQLGFYDIINRMLTWDEKQCLHSPATHILAIIINILSGRRVALYKVHKFFEEKDTEILFGEGVKPSHLNDDALSRTLDKFYDANPKKVFSTLALKALMHENIDAKILHGDTTARLLYGEYDEGEEEGLLKITWGYNKEHRTDLKQFKVGIVATKEGFPIFGEVEDGNLDDKSWNKNLIENFAENITPDILKDVVYIADSALVTGTNLSLIEKKNLKFISRLPSTFNLTSELIEEAFSLEEGWEEYSPHENKTSYKLKEFEAEIFNRRYRMVVVCPLTFDKRKLKGFESRLKKEKEKLEKEIGELGKIGFACEADAREAFNRFLKEKQNSIYKIKGDIELCLEKQKRNKRGRPSKDEQIQQKPVYRIKVMLEEPDEETLKREKQRINSFVLITNIFDGYAAQSILREYKEQTVVENRFRFIKNPLYVGPLFVKKSQRLEALSYVVLIALLIYIVIQIRVRCALKREKEPLELVGKVKNFEPTGGRILELFEYVKILKVSESDKIKRYLPEKYIKELRRVMNFLKIHFDIFTNPL